MTAGTTTPAERRPRLLYQLLGTITSTKARRGKELTAIYRRMQSRSQFDGMVRTYAPLDEADQDRFPEETQTMQESGPRVLNEAREKFMDALDWEAKLDYTNASPDARADVEIDGAVILADVPVLYLLPLLKQLAEVREMVSKLPLLDPAFDWSFDATTNTYRTPATQQRRTKKILRNHVKSPATDKHPAQVETFTEDVVVGNYTVRKASSAFPAIRQAELLERIERMIVAVRVAKETANAAKIVDPKPGAAILNWVFDVK